jgi:hypothetical protein
MDSTRIDKISEIVASPWLHIKLVYNDQITEYVEYIASLIQPIGQPLKNSIYTVLIHIAYDQAVISTPGAVNKLNDHILNIQQYTSATNIDRLMTLKTTDFLTAAIEAQTIANTLTIVRYILNLTTMVKVHRVYFHSTGYKCVLFTQYI